MTARRGNGQAYLNKYTGTADPRNPQNGEKMACAVQLQQALEACRCSEKCVGVPSTAEATAQVGRFLVVSQETGSPCTVQRLHGYPASRRVPMI